jgi:predicted small secreted protein
MKSSLKRTALPVLILGLLALLFMGCQTTKGFGRDVERAGEKIQGH